MHSHLVVDYVPLLQFSLSPSIYTVHHLHTPSSETYSHSLPLSPTHSSSLPLPHTHSSLTSLSHTYTLLPPAHVNSHTPPHSLSLTSTLPSTTHIHPQSDENFYTCAWSYDTGTGEGLLAIGGMKGIIRVIGTSTASCKTVSIVNKPMVCV